MQRKFWQVILILGLMSAAGFGAEPDKIWYVDADSEAPSPDGLSWATAYSSLQQAIGRTDNLEATTEHIYVANGTYKPGANSSHTFTMKNTVQVFGGFEGAIWPGGIGGEPDLAARTLDSDQHAVDPTEDSVLSGDLNGDDTMTNWLAFWNCYCHNCIPSGCEAFDFDGDGDDVDYHDANMNENSDHIVTFPVGSNFNDAVLDGFSIVQGRNDGSVPNSFATDGGPAIKFESGEGTVRNCTLKHNFSPSASGGAIYGSEGDVMGGRFVNLLISENYTGHGSFGGKAMTNTYLVNSQIVDNLTSDNGAGLWLQGVPPSRVTIVNTLIARNKTKIPGIDGGGIYHTSGIGLTILNCTIADNDAGNGNGGGLYTDPGGFDPNGWPELLIENTIFWGNTASAGKQLFERRQGSDKVRIRHSNIRQFEAGDIDGSAGHIAFIGSANLGTTSVDDPLFIDPTATRSDYSLQVTSPSVDAAMIGLLATDILDLDGDGDTGESIPYDLTRGPRRVDELTAPDCSQSIGACGAWPVPDMGAYEYISDCNSNDVADSEDIGQIIEVSDTRLYPADDQAAELIDREFGHAVAVSGDQAAVSGPGMSDGSSTRAGVVHTFTFSGGTWTRDNMILTLPPPLNVNNREFGSSLAMSGNFLLVGADSSVAAGLARIYELISGVWTFRQELTYPGTAVGDAFGVSVDIDASTGVAIVGASLADGAQGRALFYRYNGTTWDLDADIPSPAGSTTPQFGGDVAIEDTIAIVGARRADPNGLSNAGEVFVYKYDGTIWNPAGSLKPFDASAGDLFGASLGLTDGRAVIGAYSADASDDAGATMANVGAVYTFAFDGLTWTEEGRLPLPRDTYGNLIAAAGDFFGWSVAIHHSDSIGTNADRGIIVVGSTRADAIGSNSGAADIYLIKADGIAHHRRLKSPSGAAGDEAGTSVAVFGDSLMVGAAFDRFGAVAGLGPIYRGSAYMTTAITNDRNWDGIIDDCVLPDPIPASLLAGDVEDSNRFVSMSLPQSPEPNFALRLRVVSIHDPAPSNQAAHPATAEYDMGGALRWIGPVRNCEERLGSLVTFKCAPLQCTPHYANWQTALAGENLYVYGTDVVPSSNYEIEVNDDTCVGT